MQQVPPTPFPHLIAAQCRQCCYSWLDRGATAGPPAAFVLVAASLAHYAGCWQAPAVNSWGTSTERFRERRRYRGSRAMGTDGAARGGALQAGRHDIEQLRQQKHS